MKHFAAALLGILAAAALTLAPDPAAARTEPDRLVSGFYQLRIDDLHGNLIGDAALTCRPHGGTHPRPAAACAALAQASGHVDRLEPAPGMCTLEYQPVVLHAEGVWQGRPHVYKAVHSNPCSANLATGGVVFDLD